MKVTNEISILDNIFTLLIKSTWNRKDCITIIVPDGVTKVIVSASDVIKAVKNSTDNND
jgi:hypothetical protein